MNTTILTCWILLAAVAFSPIPQAVFGQTAPQRTLTSNPSNGAAPKTATPGARRPGEPGNAAEALDSLTMSLQDLDAIRDGNLTRVQKDGCPAEVASRLADLRGKLRQFEGGVRGEAPVPAAPAKDKRGAADPQAIAGEWFKHRLQDEPEALGQAAGSPSSRSSEPASGSREGKLLADVLPGALAAAAQAPETAQSQTAVEEQIARLRTEIAQLSGACTAPKK